MKITIYSVNPADRPWDDWLDMRLADSREIDRENYHEARWYQGAERFLTLIHFGGDLKKADDAKALEAKALEIDKSWLDLGPGVRERVFWLIYSGSGYSKLETSHPRNIHYFYYPIDRISFTHDDRVRFQKLLRALEDLDNIDKAVWDILKPAGNIHAATVLAILAAEKWVDITLAVDSLISEKDTINNAHREFSALLPAGTRPPTLGAWMTALRQRGYSGIRDQISATLGAVPD
jgi:hypothetical protein